MKKQKWFIQTYDEDGVPCKLPRIFYGTRAEANNYVQNVMSTIVDVIWNRTFRLYSSKEYSKYDLCPNKNVNDRLKKK